MPRSALSQVVLAACTIVLLALAPASAEEGGRLERAIKATYLYKFAPFVEWPKTALGSPGSPFVICVLGADPFARVLDEAVAGQRLFGRPITVGRVSAVAANSGCQILFAGASPTQSVAAALAAVRGTPVLTVTDSEDNEGAKGIINFVIEDNHVRFQIDDAAAAANGLVISSKLLSLAVAVTPRT
jgi:hypothetical protein